MVNYMKLENTRNGLILGLTASAALLWGDKIREPIIKFINGLQPEQLSVLGNLWAPLIILLIGGIIGVIVDRT